MFTSAIPVNKWFLQNVQATHSKCQRIETTKLQCNTDATNEIYYSITASTITRKTNDTARKKRLKLNKNLFFPTHQTIVNTHM